MAKLLSKQKGEIFNISDIVSNRLHTLEGQLSSLMGTINTVTGAELALPSTSGKKRLHTHAGTECPGADPGFDRGAPDCDRPKLPMVHSSVMQVKRALFSMGSRACLRAPEALGYFITKYAFSPFWGTFLYYF